MSLQGQVTANETFPSGVPVTLEMFRRSAVPNFNFQGAVNASVLADLSIGNSKIGNSILNLATKGLPDSLDYTVVAPGGLTAKVLKAGAYFYAAATLSSTVYGFALSPTECNPLAYAAGQRFYFTADVVNPTGGTQVNVNSVGAKNLKKRVNGTLVALAAGDIAAGQLVEIIYDGTQFVMVSPVGNAGTGTPIVAALRNLVLKYVTAGTVNFSADDVILKNSDGTAVNVTPSNITVDITASGVNGLDAGSEGASTWYYIYCIFDGTNVKGLLSASATAPTLPTGYTYKALLGAVRNNSSSDFVSFYQTDRRVWLQLTALFTGGTLPRAATAGDTYQLLANGTPTSSTDLTVFQGLVPPIAKTVAGVAGSGANLSSWITVAGDSSGTGAVAVNGGVNTSTGTDSFGLSAAFEIPLITSQNFYWKCHDTTARNRIAISGYTI